MKSLMNSVVNTIKAVKLLSNPQFSEMLQKELQRKSYNSEAFHHKHYVVQVVS